MSRPATGDVVDRVVDGLERVVRRVGLVRDPAFVAEFCVIVVVGEEIVNALLEGGEVREEGALDPGVVGLGGCVVCCGCADGGGPDVPLVNKLEGMGVGM